VQNLNSIPPWTEIETELKPDSIHTVPPPSGKRLWGSDGDQPQPCNVPEYLKVRKGGTRLGSSGPSYSGGVQGCRGGERPASCVDVHLPWLGLYYVLQDGERSFAIVVKALMKLEDQVEMEIEEKENGSVTWDLLLEEGLGRFLEEGSGGDCRWVSLP